MSSRSHTATAEPVDVQPYLRFENDQGTAIQDTVINQSKSAHVCVFECSCFMQAAAAGKVPAEVLRADADALAAGKPLPYARLAEEPTPVNSRPVAPLRQAGPLDHS